MKPDVTVALHAVGVFRETIAALQEVVEQNSELACLAEWLPALSAKVDAFAEAVLTGGGASLPPWHSGEFARRMRTEQGLHEALAREVLSHFREMETQTNAVISALAKQRPATQSLLRLLGATAGDVVSVQSAICGRFPHLEERIGSGAVAARYRAVTALVKPLASSSRASCSLTEQPTQPRPRNRAA